MSYTSDERFPQKGFFEETDPEILIGCVDSSADSRKFSRFSEPFERDMIAEEVNISRHSFYQRIGLAESYVDGSAQSFDGVLSDLRSSHWPIRVAAIKILEVLCKDSDIIAQNLVKALDDESVYVRAAAVQALGNQKASVSKTHLLLAIRDRAWMVRAAVIYALGKLGPNVPIGTVIAALRDDEDAFVRVAATCVLGKLRRPELFGFLVEAMKDESAAVRLDAITVIDEQKGNMLYQDNEVIHELIKALRDDDEQVRLQSLNILGKYQAYIPGSVFVKALRNGEEEERLAAISILGERDDSQSLEALLYALNDADEQVQESASKLLGKQDERIPKQISSQFFLRLLKDESIYLRTVAAWALGEKKEIGTKRALLAAQYDVDASVRAMVRWALCELDGSDTEKSGQEELVDEGEILPHITRHSLGEHISKQTFLIQILQAILNYLEGKKGYVHPEIFKMAKENVLVLTCFIEMQGQSLREEVLEDLNIDQHVADLDAVLRGEDETLQFVAKQALERFEERSWSELFIASFDVLHRFPKENEEDFPSRVIFWSVSCSQVRHTDSSVLSQLLSACEKELSSFSTSFWDDDQSQKVKQRRKQKVMESLSVHDALDPSLLGDRLHNMKLCYEMSPIDKELLPL